MAITRSQQAKQMLQDGGRIGLFKGAVASGENISPGTDVGGNVRDDNPFTGGGENKPPIVVPKTLKKGLDLGGEAMFLKNLIELNPVGVMKNIGSKLILDKLISEVDTGQDQNMMLADALTIPTEGKFGVSLNDYSKLKNAGYNDNQIQELQLNPKIDVKEVIRDIEGPIFAAADGGNVVGGEFDFETARQMYGLGKLVKKVTRAVKKVAKSPIGKAALLYTGLGGLGSLAQGGSFFSNFASPMSQLRGVGSIFKAGGLDNIMSGLKLGKFVGPPSDRVLEKNFLGKLITSPTALITGASAVAGALTPEQEDEAQQLADNTGIDIEEARNSILAARREQYAMDVRARGFKADGGIMRAGYQEGSKEPVAKKTMPLLDMGGMEKDYREDGGFVPIGRMERADDVPARLSKNEFVFTADAVRNAGDGDIDKGAEVMYNMMKNLEAGGEVSEESQGLEGARRMFQTSQRLEEVL